MINSWKLFDESEKAHPITEDEFIKVEDIKGKVLLIGGADDALWNVGKYLRRMEKRMSKHPHECEVEAVVYEHATHFVFPEGLMKTMLPVAEKKFFKWSEKHRLEQKRKTKGDIIFIA